MEEQCLEVVEFINERKALSEVAAMDIQGVDNRTTLDKHEVSMHGNLSHYLPKIGKLILAAR